ncbi:LacI family transcriptional regulator [Paraliobacillus quinghaiensis]|uniref:LacI family transcriptional regulator n=1 Tax=Paraliobacillus quinghaiensis TaxID=470815 RepID=A0A917TDW0_9BACI|nr:LacI family DNA-binding transcriptional regulator [Paraliobacillus quinghaiensis]GGM19565.1 LacI family transcriptional regulator [Paraliobacillus quinghaiensis]
MKHTIKDVAKRANVSIATVSRILNEKDGYSEDTKEMVLRVIEELGYHPNAIARGLINNKTHTVGVLVPSLTGTFATELLSGIEQVTHEVGSNVIVCYTEFQGVKTMKYLQMLNEKRVDGIIFISAELTEEYYSYVESMSIPMVLLCSESDKYQVPYVRVNDRAGGYTATKYLIDNGHRNIGLISGSEDDVLTSVQRAEGYKAALIDHNIAVNENNMVFNDDFLFEDGIQGMKTLMERAPDLTAVFAASDELALGAISVAYQYNKRVPEDISVIGYDNLRLAEMSHPPLTSVSQPLNDMGAKAAQMLFEMQESKMITPSCIMPHQIIERKSVHSLKDFKKK